jgi:hypothetical protein
MGSPFGKPPVKELFPVTERQLDFLCSLQREILASQGYTPDDALVYMDAYELQARQLSREAASASIDAAKAELAVAKIQAAQRDTSRDEGIEGFWELPDGRICKVQIAVHGSGRPYAKLLNTETGNFGYDPSLIKDVRREGTRLTLDRAKELGQLYGMCIRCGATLTDENSIAAGIGPICATRF